MNVFHGTCSKHRDSINRHGLDPDRTTFRKDHWLGQGLYFFESADLAKWWADTLAKKHPEYSSLIYRARINAPDSRVLNLDDNKQVDAFYQECIQYVHELGKHSNGRQPVFSLKGIARAVFLDYYKKTHREIAVVIATFEKDCAGYTAFRNREDLEIQTSLMGLLKIKYHERQVCVWDRSVIQDVQIYYDAEEEIL